ncbi:MAG: hypothetical protein WCD76_09470, partial [Pyrinomonadaceae bacterium]
GLPLANQFPVYAYLEVSHVRRISSGFDLGIRAVAQMSTAEVFGGRPSTPADPAAQFNQSFDQYREASRHDTAPAPPTPNLGVTIFGSFF